jgi:hypothetical protein
MLKRELEEKLAVQKAENERIRRGLNMAIDGLNSLSVGLGRRRGGQWSASYLAADTLANIAKLWGTK